MNTLTENGPPSPPPTTTTTTTTTIGFPGQMSAISEQLSY